MADVDGSAVTIGPVASGAGAEYTIGSVNGSGVTSGCILSDGIGPAISGVTPSVGSEIARFEPFEFDVGDADGLKQVIITIKFANISDAFLCYDDEGFHGRFITGSTYTPNSGTIEDPAHFSVVPDGGWFGSVEEIKVNVIDNFGAKSGVDI